MSRKRKSAKPVCGAKHSDSPQHREPGTPPRIGNGFADATSETYCRSSVFFSLLPDKAFYDRPATCRFFAKAKRQADEFQQSTGRDSDNPPSCVVGLSQTRHAWTGQFHFFSALLFFQINHITQCYPFLNNRSGVIICEEIWNTVRI